MACGRGFDSPRIHQNRGRIGSQTHKGAKQINGLAPFLRRIRPQRHACTRITLRTKIRRDGLGAVFRAESYPVAKYLLSDVAVRAAIKRASTEGKPITINDVLQSPVVKVREGLKYLFQGKGLLSICSATAHTVMRSRPDETSPDLKIQLQPFSGKDRYARRPQDGLDPHSGFTVGVMALKPKSRGWVHISSPDPLAFPKINPKYLDNPEDAQVLLAGIKAVRRVASFPSLQKLIVRETRPSDAVVTDEQLMHYIRETTQTTWHVVGSCMMGRDASDSVVDSELRVHGVDGLRVADSSVFPTIPSSNTNAPTIALGEKAADIIKHAWSNRGQSPSARAA